MKETQSLITNNTQIWGSSMWMWLGNPKYESFWMNQEKKCKINDFMYNKIKIELKSM